ncbi:helix-turn-helix transcriptional regulator [Seohaeicola nanhaiensis]|uniref:Helix-turn-helix transcriptional regulator n=1 Tax=Seohaeicola nanhaiensis TaxID=1387282 RepID=A0ABV9KIH5_9RHOB
MTEKQAQKTNSTTPVWYSTEAETHVANMMDFADETAGNVLANQGNPTDANAVVSLIRHLTPAELASRWRVSPRTLERWRVNGIGPCWLKLCGRVVYRQNDVAAFEAEALHGLQDE